MNIGARTVYPQPKREYISEYSQNERNRMATTPALDDWCKWFWESASKKGSNLDSAGDFPGCKRMHTTFAIG